MRRCGKSNRGIGVPPAHGSAERVWALDGGVGTREPPAPSQGIDEL